MLSIAQAEQTARASFCSLRRCLLTWPVFVCVSVCCQRIKATAVCIEAHANKERGSKERGSGKVSIGRAAAWRQALWERGGVSASQRQRDVDVNSDARAIFALLLLLLFTSLFSFFVAVVFLNWLSIIAFNVLWRSRTRNYPTYAHSAPLPLSYYQRLCLLCNLVILFLFTCLFIAHFTAHKINVAPSPPSFLSLPPWYYI